MKDDTEVTIGSGNVFRDLGLANPEQLMVKARLVHAITCLISERGLSQVQAARILGVDQPKVSALMCGKLSGFSLERLLRFAEAMDCDVDLRIVPRRESRTSPGLTTSAPKPERKRVPTSRRA